MSRSKSKINKTRYPYFFLMKLNQREINLIRDKKLSISISPRENNIYLIHFYAISWKKAREEFIKIISGLKDLQLKIVPMPLSLFESVFRTVRNIALASSVWEAQPEIINFLKGLNQKNILELLNWLFKEIRKRENRYKNRHKDSCKLLDNIISLQKEIDGTKKIDKFYIAKLLTIFKKAAYFNISVPFEKVYPNIYGKDIQ